jgi:hypothetical protein
MVDSQKYPIEYESTIRPQVNKWLKKLFFSFIGCSLLLIVTPELLKFLGFSQKLTAIVFLPCGIFYVYQILSIKDVKCPICKKPLYYSLYIAKIPFKLNSLSGKSCNHCGARFR